MSTGVDCPSCGAPVEWDPGSRSLACTSCGAHTPVPVDQGHLGAHTLEDASQRWPDRPRRPGTRRLQCSECGAVVETGPGALTGRCAFCGSSAVAEATDDGTSFPPDGVLPLTVSRAEATAAYRTWLGRHWFKPGDLGRRSHLETLTPVYVPFWAFDFGTRSKWTCDVGRRQIDDTMGPAGVVGGEMDWHRVTGDLHHAWRGLLAQGSTGLPEALWRGLEPFPVDQAGPYDARFLAGFAAEEARTQPLTAWQSVREATEANRQAAAEEALPPNYDARRDLHVRVGYEQVAFRQLLLPVWVAAYRYQDRTFRFLVNGATGVVQGHVPRSARRIAALVLVGLALVAWGAYGVRDALFALDHGTVGLVHRAEAVVEGHHHAPRQVSGAESAREAGLVPVRGTPGPVHLHTFPDRPRPVAAAPGRSVHRHAPTSTP